MEPGRDSRKIAIHVERDARSDGKRNRKKDPARERAGDRCSDGA
jgi:hypothetical protein